MKNDDTYTPRANREMLRYKVTWTSNCANWRMVTNDRFLDTNLHMC